MRGGKGEGVKPVPIVVWDHILLECVCVGRPVAMLVLGVGIWSEIPRTTLSSNVSTNGLILRILKLIKPHRKRLPKTSILVMVYFVTQSA